MKSVSVTVLDDSLAFDSLRTRPRALSVCRERGRRLLHVVEGDLESIQLSDSVVAAVVSPRAHHAIAYILSGPRLIFVMLAWVVAAIVMLCVFLDFRSIPTWLALPGVVLGIGNLLLMNRDIAVEVAFSATFLFLCLQLAIYTWAMCRLFRWDTRICVVWFWSVSVFSCLFIDAFLPILALNRASGATTVVVISLIVTLIQIACLALETMSDLDNELVKLNGQIQSTYSEIGVTRLLTMAFFEVKFLVNIARSHTTMVARSMRITKPPVAASNESV